MTNDTMEQAAEILLSMRRDPYVYYDGTNRCFRPKASLPGRASNGISRAESLLQRPAGDAPSRASTEPPSPRERFPLPEQGASQDSDTQEEKEVPTRGPSTRTSTQSCSPKESTTNQRRQQDFTPWKTDAAFGEQKPTKGERFCKCLAYHMSERVNSPKKGTDIAKLEYLKLEAYTRVLGPFHHAEDTDSSQTSTGPNALGPAGLTRPENDFCQRLDLPVEKYRAMKARMLFGWACIIEQNLRGGGRRLRRCHPFLGDDDKFRCINLGLSQAQWLCRGYDANVASKVCKQLQEWGWLPNSSIFRSHDDGVVGVPPEVQALYPQAARNSILAEAMAWDIDKGVPLENRMVIVPGDLLPPDGDAAGGGFHCGCTGSGHSAVRGFLFPQGTKSCLRRND